MLAFAFPTPGHTNEEVKEAIHAEIERLKSEPISDEELAMVKTRAKAGLLRTLSSNNGMAQELATSQTLFGGMIGYHRAMKSLNP